MASPFDDIRQLLSELPATRVPDADDSPLGRLAQVAAWLSAWSGKARPQIGRPIVAIYAAAHGVASRAGLKGPPVRGAMEAMAAGGAALNAIAQMHGAGLDVFDLAVDRPVADITDRAAMSEKECAATMAFGMEALAKQPDLLVLGEIGLGGEIAAAAVACALFGGDAAEWSAHGGLVAQAVLRATGEGMDGPLDILRQLGGREMAAIAGAVAAARMQGVPVLLDGYGACAAAAVLKAVRPDAVDHCMAAHVSTQPGHRRLLEALGLEPLLDLGLSAGSGEGGAAALGVIRLACETSGLR